MSIATLKDLWYKAMCKICWLACIFCFRCFIYGRHNVPASGPFLLVSNHQCYFDPVFCTVFIKRMLNYLARDTLFSNWFIGWLLRSVKAVPLKRGKADLGAIKTILSKLKTGNAVCLYPEATRTPDGRIAEFKGGIGLLCRRAKVPIVPVVIDGAFEAWPRDKKLFTFRSPISISYGEPIMPEQLKGVEDRAIARMLTETLRKMQSEIRLKNEKEPFDY
jgi:1-acyl-sn-glycerol-3-phosphate acyltransferase